MNLITEPGEFVNDFRQKASASLTEALQQQRGDFFQKYIADVYTKRAEAEGKFHRFVNQMQQPCFVVTGRAGKGKTMLLCHLADFLPEPRIPLLLNSSNFLMEKQSVQETILQQIPQEISLEQLGRTLNDAETMLVIFIDAVNELKGENAFSQFTEQLTSLLHTVHEAGYPILFCISCRSEFWGKEIDPSAWDHHIFDSLGEGKPTYELGNFDKTNIQKIIETYFNWFAIDGELIGSAEEDCRDPIMLRYLCEAYSRRPSNDKQTHPSEIKRRDIGKIRTLRRKAVFDRFVKQKRQDIVAAAMEATRLTDVERLYQRTTRYLIHMANAMLQQRRPYITVDHAMDVADALGHPDADLSRSGFVESPKSIFFHFVDEGIILDKLSAEKRELGDERYEFVFEAYFEYSLGRYIALERWPGLAGEEIDPTLICADFRELLQEHLDILQSEATFTNLLGALQTAVLVTEKISDASEETVAEEDLYRKHPDLFIQLIEQMVDFSKVGGLDWLQYACATIRETALASKGEWHRFQDDPDKVKQAEELFQKLLTVIEKLTNQTDFVVLWDLENTLRILAEANFDLTISRMKEWAENGTGLQPMFATQVLAKLSVTYPETIVEILLSLAELPQYRQNFWLARILIYAASMLFAEKRNGRIAAASLSASQQWQALQQVVQTFAQSEIPAVRGVALAALPIVSEGDQELLDFVSRRVQQEDWSWALWNLAFELQQWPRAYPEEWLWQTLAQLADLPDDHIRYAVDKSAKILAARDKTRANAIRDRLKGSRWLAVTPNGRFGPNISQLGIVYYPQYLEPAYDNHIECRERIQAILNKLIQVGSDYINWVDPIPVAESWLKIVHNAQTDQHRNRVPWPDYINDVRREAERVMQEGYKPHTVQQIGPSELRFESYETALVSAGGVLKAVDYVSTMPAPAAIAVNRPPGHLANNTICIFNNIAIGARYAQEQYGLKRIIVIDCDAHHGKHTNQVFIADPDVIYFSMHIQGDYARENGQVHHTGEESGKGYNFNLPYPPYMPDEGYMYMIDKLLIPVIRDFQPQLIMISAGFDGHVADPLTGVCILSDEAFIYLAERLRAAAQDLDVKIVGCTEGGYGLDALANMLTHMARIFGNWPIAKEDVGFTPLPTDYEALRQKNPDAMQEVRQTVRQRVELIAEEGIFDVSQPHWQAILTETAPGL